MKKILSTLVVLMLIIGMTATFNCIPKGTRADLDMKYLTMSYLPTDMPAPTTSPALGKIGLTLGWNGPIQASSTVANDANTQYRFDHWGIWLEETATWNNQTANPYTLTLNENTTVYACYMIQYKLTFTTGYEAHGALPYVYNGSWYQTSTTWFDSGAQAWVGIGGLDGSDGVYLDAPYYNQWAHFVNFTVPGVHASANPPQHQSDMFYMTGALSVRVNWEYQYKLYVMPSDSGNPGYHPPTTPAAGQYWCWQNTIQTLTAPPGASSPPPLMGGGGGQGYRYIFDHWAVTPNDGTSVFFDASVNVTMNTNKTATAFYRLELYLLVWDWPLNGTTTPNLYTTYSGWYPNGTVVGPITAPDTLSSGTGIRYKFTGWWERGTGMITDSTHHQITIHVEYLCPSFLPLEYQACINELQYYLTVKTDPLGVVYPPAINASDWYDAGSVVPIGTPQIVPIDTGSRYEFVQWDKEPGPFYDTNNWTTVTMFAPRNATADYNLEHKLIVRSDPSAFYWEYWIINSTSWYPAGGMVSTGWWYYADLGPWAMSTMVFHHWDIINTTVTTLAQGQQTPALILVPTTFLAHYVNQTFVILSGNTLKSAPGAYCTSFDVNVTFANFNSLRTVGGEPMDLYGAEFTVQWTPGLFEMTGYTAYLSNIWPTGSYIESDAINNAAGTFSFAAHAINTGTGFDGTRVMLTLHFHVIYEPCYSYDQSTWMYMTVCKLANHLGHPIYAENYNWCWYYIYANEPKLALEPSQTTWTYITDANRFFTVDVMGYNLVKVRE